ncbi:MAG: 16S rRNA (uracil(1498)-N(3))-methyltransferase [Candidatus Margulisbacteria bacterium]|nr:16S rRNA (uracil(1498)-N(3))-methyltransferase [Candidatus Margulisiibacteriota bacterium]
MHRIFIKDTQWHNTLLLLSDEQTHHLNTVIRIKKNDPLEITTTNKTYQIIVRSIQKNKLEFLINEETTHPKKEHRITLIQALPKQDKFAEIIKKCTELGIDEIIPVITERCLVKAHNIKQENKLERWNKIALAASEQSKRTALPEIHPIYALRELKEKIDLQKYDVKLVCWEEEKKQTLKSLLTENKNPRNILIFIGPEGGISQEEMSFLTQLNFQSVSISETILRVENAAFLAIANILYASQS